MQQQKLDLFQLADLAQSNYTHSHFGEEKIQSPFARPDWITDGVLEQMILSHRPAKVPQGFAGGEKQSFSPTMLEAFDRCPFGWFVQTIADIPQSYRSRTRQGGDLHNLVDYAGKFGLSSAEERLETEPFDNREANLLILQNIYKQYFEQWPTPKERLLEKRLEMTLPSGHTIAGRADRIDFFEQGVLVIDWKLQCQVTPTTLQKRMSQKQRYLYPLMAAQSFGYNPLGMLYVSLQDNKHEGSMCTALECVDMSSVSMDWQKESKQALQEVERIITEMEQGLWWRRGEHCAEWCGCKREQKAKNKWL